MSFPSSTGTVQQDCARAWALARSLAADIKAKAQVLRAASLASIMTSSQVLGFTTYLADMRFSLNEIAAVSGIAAYAQAQIADNTINIAAEFSSMVSALDAVVSWVIANFPKTPTNELRAVIFAGDNSGRTVDVVFSAAATAGLRTQLDALIATIN